MATATGRSSRSGTSPRKGASIAHSAASVIGSFTLFSDLEWAALLAYESSPGVTEIREQVLLDRTQTFDLAEKLGIRHPRFGNIVWPMTTDLVVSRNEALEPVCVKYSRDLLKKRVKEKVELEAEYWRSLGFPLRIFTEQSLELDALRSLEVIRPFFWMTGVINPPSHLMPAIADAWRAELGHAQHVPVSLVCTAMDRAFGLEVGGAQAMLYHLVARGIVVTPLTPALTLKRLACDFRFAEAPQ